MKILLVNNLVKSPDYCILRNKPLLDLHTLVFRKPAFCLLRNFDIEQLIKEVFVQVVLAIYCFIRNILFLR